MRRATLVALASLVAAVLLAQAPSGPARPPPAVIGWWNAKRLGHGHKDWLHMSHVASSFDVLGIGEVMTPEGLRTLVTSMPGGDAAWGSVISPEAVGRGNYREFYGVLYRRSVARCDEGSKIVYPDPGDQFAREPFGVNCRVGRFDFTMVTLHAIFGHSVAERASEVGHLGEVYRWFQDRDPNEQDILIVGDFNLRPEHAAWSAALTHDGLRRLLHPSLLTTISEGQLRNHYDDIIIDPRFTTEFAGEAGGRDLAAEAGTLMLAERTLSDHRPVFATFAIGADDD